MRFVSLREIADIQLGKMLSPKAKTGMAAFPYLRNQNVQWGRFDLRDMAAMDFDEREREKFSLRRGDLLLCEGGEPGRCAVWEEQIPGCYYQKALHRIRPHEGIADSEFLSLWIRLQAYTGAFDDQNAKTTIAHLPLVRLEQFHIPAVSVAEQRRIAARLKAQLAEVETARQAARTQVRDADALCRAFLQGAFDELPGQRVILGDVARIDARLVNPTAQEFSPLPHVSAENISPVTGKLQNIRSASEDGMESGKYQFDAGDVLYSKLRPYLRKVAIAEFCGLCSADMYPLKFDNETINGEFLRGLLVSNDFTAYANEMSARSRMPKLNREQLFAYAFPLPSVNEQRRIVARLQSQLAEADAIQQATAAQLADIERLPQRLLAQVFDARGDAT